MERLTQVTLLSRVGLMLDSLLQPAAGTRPSEAGGQIVLDTLTWRATTIPIAGQSTLPFPPFSLLFWGTFCRGGDKVPRIPNWKHWLGWSLSGQMSDLGLTRPRGSPFEFTELAFPQMGLDLRQDLTHPSSTHLAQTPQRASDVPQPVLVTLP